MAQVDFGGITREVCLDYLPEAAVGNYCIVHVGFAITLLSEAEARETLAMLEEIAEIERVDEATGLQTETPVHAQGSDPQGQVSP